MSTAIDTLHADIDEIMPGVVADRRYLHTIPELGLQEFKTSAFVLERLQALPVEDIRTGLAVTGITALLRGTKPSTGPEKVLLLRADMDGLPILEETGLEFASQHAGAMHACGHDGHTSMLLGIARVLSDRRDQFSGTVKLLFQPAEEGPGGAKPMIEQGVLEDPHVDVVFGMHADSRHPVGNIELAPGAIAASMDGAVITIQGVGGHGASPHMAVDPVIIAAHIAVALQTIVSREIDPIKPAVITVGMIRSGEAANVIPDTAEMRLTIRSFDPGVRALQERRITEIATGVAEAFGATARIDYWHGYPAMVNEPEMTALVIEAATEAMGPENVVIGPPQMGSEDFAFFLLERPGAFFNVGTRNDERGIVWDHHHPRFDMDEDGLAVGIEVMTRVVLKYLG
ncbi:M20 family metallopeptidase [soil metagenome]